MRVILNQDIPNLGEEGDIKKVADGYARNYLLPRKLVMPYTKQNLLILEKRREAIEKRKEDKRKNALDMKGQLETETLEFAMPAGASGKLFGSVNPALIAEALEKKGYHIEKKRIEIPEHSIRMIGEYEVKVKLYEQKEAVIKVIVANQEASQEVKQEEKQEVKQEASQEEKQEVKQETNQEEKQETNQEEKQEELQSTE